MDKILTVVIPVYNMEKYLDNCLQSFIFDKEEKGLELLVVNDGSKDNSLKIANEYAKKYPDIFKVIDKENGGHGSTINAGLKVATGKYFKVVDSDDWVDTDNFAKMFNDLKDLSTDCVICNGTTIVDGTNKRYPILSVKMQFNQDLQISQAKKDIFYMSSTTFLTKKIKDTTLTEKCFYVDAEYNSFTLSQCKDYICLPYNVYMYRIGRPGQSVSDEGFYKHRDNHLTIVKSLINNYYAGNKSYLTLEKCKWIVKWHYFNYIRIFYKDKNLINELKDFDAYLKKYDELYKSSNKYFRIRTLRRHNFKNIKIFLFIKKIKQTIKKIIRA